MIFRFRQESVDIATVIRERLQDAMQNRTDDLRKFVPRSSLEEIWTEDCLRTFVRQYRPFDDADIPNIRKNFLQTLSILIQIHWDRWKSFKAIFVDNGGRADNVIHTYTWQLLHRESFLGPIWAGAFLSNRYIYCPADIIEGMVLEYNEGWRLPFLARGRNRGTHPPGFEGDAVRSVTKVEVARGHLYLSPNSRFRGPYLACKRFRTRGDFAKEKSNLLALKERLDRNEMEDRIMPFFASVSVGGEFNLLSEWADGDLESFLQEESRSFGLCDLMEEARNLAGALAFLHGGPNSKQLFCHLDLKPANILVFRESPTSVGRWKISDFGNSVFTPATGPWPDGSFPPMSNLGGIVGTYQSPEVFYGEGLGRKSDVWSLGCILVRILAFGLGGSVLRDLDNRRRQMMINGEPSCHDCFHCRYPPVLNPHIETWIKGLPTRSNHQLMQQACQRFRSLLLRTLEVNKEARLTAEEVKGGLGSILKILLPPKSFLPSTLSIDASHLLTSIQNGDFDGLGSQLRYNVDVEVPTEDAGKKERLLVHGIRRNSYETVESLLDSRPRMDIESPASDGQTPLACVIATGDKRIFKLLLEAGANIDAPSKNGITPLMLATEYGHVSIVRSLLDSGAECLAYCNKGYTCVHYIAWARKGGVQMIAEFQGRGSYLNLRCRGGNESPLSTLIKAHDETDEWQSKFNAFLAAGVDVNSPDQRGRTPLYYAGLDDLKEVAIKLLQKGARLSPDLEPALLDRKVPSWMKALLREHDGGSNGSLHEPRSSWRAALRRMRSS